MSRIKLVTLDLDNTLWDVDSVIVKAEADMVAWLEAHVPDSLPTYRSDTLNDIRLQVFDAHQSRAHDLSFMRTAVMQALFEHTGYGAPEAATLARRAFDVFFQGRNRVVFFPGAQEMLAELASRYTLFALTNGNADIEKTGLGKYLTGGFSSADVGVKKPHPQMFEAPLKHVDAHPRQAVHVGDHLIDDIKGAADVGMHTVWVNMTATQRQPDIIPTSEVSTLDQVVESIRKLD